MKIFKYEHAIGIDFNNRFRIGWFKKNIWKLFHCGIRYDLQKNTDRYRKSILLKVYRFAFQIVLTRFAKWPD
jgi:hypothetical protein